MDLAARPARLALWAIGSLPLAGLVLAAATDRLGAEPVETITHVTGQWALRLLLASLAVTPLRRLAGAHWLAPHRRTLGLLAFGYALLHFLTYLVLDLELALGELTRDVLERPYVTVGFATLVVLAVLATTSTRGWMRRLGARWSRLHRLVYLAALGAVVHFAWSVKADLREPLVYAAAAGGLLVLRLVPRGRRAGRGGATYATLPRSMRAGDARSPGRAADET